MKKAILFILVTGAVIFVCLSASENKTINLEVTDNSNTSVPDSIIKGCWRRQADDSLLYIPWVIDSGPHKHLFYIENYIDPFCPDPTFGPLYVHNGNKGIGQVTGFQFLFTLFGSVDTVLYHGLITDTTTGQKQMEVYSLTDTIVYYAQ